MVQGGSSAELLSVLLEARLTQVQGIRATGAIQQEAIRIADQRILQRSGLAKTNDELAPFSDYCARRELLWGPAEPISHEWSRTRLQGLRNEAHNLTSTVSEVGPTLIAWLVSLGPRYALPRALRASR